MTGGSGSVIKLHLQLLQFKPFLTGLYLMGLGFDAQVLAAGILLGLVVVYESYSIYKQGLKKGERVSLLEGSRRTKSQEKNHQLGIYIDTELSGKSCLK